MKMSLAKLTRTFLIATALVVLGSGCVTCQTKGPHDIRTYVKTAVMRKGERLTLRVPLDPGEQLLGGGYWVENQEVNLTGPRFNVVNVLASYPSEDGDAWVVEFLYRGDKADQGNVGSQYARDNQESLVAAYAYYSTSALTLGMGIRRQDETPGGSGLAEARAPQGAVVTGGGFRMTGFGPDEPHDMANAFVQASIPLVEDGIVTGWRTRSENSVFGRLPGNITAYVLYATSGLQQGRVITIPAKPRSNQGWGPYSGSVPLQPDEFSTGGGFEFRNETASASYGLMYAITANRALNRFAEWDVYGYNGWQNAGPHPTTAGLQIQAIAIKSPYPALCVEITKPKEGASFGLDQDEPAVRSEPITFKAKAFRGDTKLPSTSIVWTIDGNQIGTGSPLVYSLPLPQAVSHTSNYWRTFRVKASVSDAGRTESDSIFINVNNVR